MTARNSEKRELVRRELLGASEQLCSKNDLSGLGLALRSHGSNLECALILDCVPEQAEDIYWVLAGFNEIAKVEVPRGDQMTKSPPRYKRWTLQRIAESVIQKRRGKNWKSRLNWCVVEHLGL